MNYFIGGEFIGLYGQNCVQRIGPWNSGLQEIVSTISGSDLTNITSNSVVIATEINTGITSPAVPSQTPNVGFLFGPQCSTWDGFSSFLKGRDVRIVVNRGIQEDENCMRLLEMKSHRPWTKTMGFAI